MKLAKKQITEIINYFELGLTETEICDITGIDAETLIELCQDDQDVKNSRRLGIKSKNIKVVEALLKSAVGYTYKDKEIEKRYGRNGNTQIYKSVKEIEKNVAPNIQAIKFWLSTKDTNWKDTMNDVEKNMNITIKVDGKDIIVQKGTDE